MQCSMDSSPANSGSECAFLLCQLCCHTLYIYSLIAGICFVCLIYVRSLFIKPAGKGYICYSQLKPPHALHRVADAVNKAVSTLL